MRGLTSVRRRVLTAATGLLMAGGVLAAVEGITRLLELAPALEDQLQGMQRDPHLPYRPIPGSVWSASGEAAGIEYRHNRHGYRDVEHQLAKPEGVFRILALGDSFTYGVAAAFEHTYLVRVEKRLNLRQGDHPHIELIKAGVPRFFPQAERLLLEQEGLGFDPDLVLVAFLPNDVIDTYLGMDAVTVSEDGYLKTREAAQLGRVGHWLYLRSHSARIVLSRVVAYRVRQKWRPDWVQMHVANGVHEADWEAVESEYARILELAEGHGARVVILFIPQRGPWAQYCSYPAERLAAWSAQNGAVYVDVLPAMKEAARDERLYWEHDTHCNAVGHQVIADVLFEALVSAQLVP